ncbi:uncharacterized protein SAMN02910447_03040 [Ruminococcus sp. YE71]|uniref:HD domain-containing protein n=1 Tax=unclassified Ruminococcus TaxID=2608920 RepID=UPI000888FF43|nr:MULTISPECIES: HD domain-containing protein [unclassified Ruminococcus]SDA29395.1 uncharacterized protein SAMN02910446_03112 [Ruminococcus sp. YE78]SFW48193.1 uncharacterized protein SAMN02910447_03040 [Ruminococcus sp. YE71]
MSRAIGSKYIVERSPQAQEYHEAVKDVLNSEEVQDLKDYHHHHCMTRFQHCLNVSYYSFLLCRKLGFNAEQAARAGLLHDLYPECPKCDRRHLTTHPETALENARKSFKLSKVEADVILKHMWPIRKGRPKYPESYVVMMTDKYVAFMEFCIYLKQTADMSLKKHI